MNFLKNLTKKYQNIEEKFLTVCVQRQIHTVHIFGWRVLQKEIFNKGKGYETLKNNK